MQPKFQISYDKIKLWQHLFFILTRTFPFIVIVCFIDLSNKELNITSVVKSSLIILTFWGLWYFISNALYFNVSFDDEFVYFSRFGRSEKISMDQITGILPSVIPHLLFQRNVYQVTVKYLDQNQEEKKIKFFSNETSINGTVDNIKFLDKLRELVRERKFSY